MTILKKIGAIVAGFIVASVIMLAFEWVNHFLFPIPVTIDQGDPTAFGQFTASLPLTAYLLVFLGFAIGAFEGGCTTTWMAGDPKFRTSAVLAVVLVIFGMFNMMALAFPTLPMLLGIIILAVFPYLGHRTLLAFEANKKAG